MSDEFDPSESGKLLGADVDDPNRLESVRTALAAQQWDRGELVRAWQALRETLRAGGDPTPEDTARSLLTALRPDFSRRLGEVESAPPRHLIEGFLVEGEINVFGGKGGSFKTTTAIACSLAYCLGNPCFDGLALVDSGGPVLFCSEEDGAGHIKNRVNALVRGHGWNQGRANESFYVSALDGLRLDVQEDRDRLGAEVASTGARVVILDPLSDMISGDENQSATIREAMLTGRAVTQLGATVVLLHHHTKDGTGLRGSSALAAAARAIWTVEYDSRRGLVVLKNSKDSRWGLRDELRLRFEVSEVSGQASAWSEARLSLRDVGLGLRLPPGTTELETSIITSAKQRPGLGLGKLRAAVGGNAEKVSECIHSLLARERLVDLSRTSPGTAVGMHIHVSPDLLENHRETRENHSRTGGENNDRRGTVVPNGAVLREQPSGTATGHLTSPGGKER